MTRIQLRNETSTWLCHPLFYLVLHTHTMFSSLGLFQSLSCPQRNNCNRPSCIFSHNLDLPSHHSLDIPVQKVQPLPQTPSANVVQRAVPSKRPFHNLAQGPSSNSNGAPSGPPTQRLRVGTAQKPVAVPAASHTSVRIRMHRQFYYWNSLIVLYRLAYRLLELILLNLKSPSQFVKHC